MRWEEVHDALRRRPFTPLRLFISDGSAYDIRHPELCVPGHRSVFVGFPGPESAEPVYDRYAIVDLAHVTRLEPLPLPTPGTGNGEPAAGA
jgi:hypothetical protein